MKEIENVVFEKDVLKKLCDNLKPHKQVFIITSPTPKQTYLPILSNMLKERGIVFWCYCLPKSPKTTPENVLKACSNVKGAKIIVSLGAGTVCDISKIVAKKMDLPLFVVPTTITHFGLFNNVAILGDAFPKYVKTNFPNKVYIDEAIIIKSPEIFIQSTLCFSLSLLEPLFSFESKEILLQENPVSIKNLSSKIKQIEELTCWLSLSKSFTILNLMDYVFDLFQILKHNFECSNLLFASMLNSSTLKNNFGEKALLCSETLFQTYLLFLKQQVVSPKDIPNREKILSLLSKIPSSSLLSTNFSPEEIFENFICSTNSLLNQKLIFNLQKNKTALTKLCFEKIQAISKFMKKFKMVFSSSSTLRMIDENNLFSCLELLPLSSSSFLPKLVSRFGYLNVV